MAFDGIVTRAIARELDNTLSTGRLSKIYQPTDTEIVLTFRSQGKNHALLLSAHPSYARVHITDDTYQNPQNPPMFCMLLRKHLAGGFLEKVEQFENERIIQLTFISKDELGDKTSKRIIMEVMGKHSNIMLVDNETDMIIDSIKHISSSVNRHRTILPGQTYKLPPSQEKLNPFTLDPADFARKLDFNSGRMPKQILNLLQGVSPALAGELAEQAYMGDKEAYAAAFAAFIDKMKQDSYEPTYFKGKKEDFYVMDLRSIEGTREHYDTMSRLIDAFYSGKAERDRVKQQAGDLIRFLKNEREKNIRKLTIHENTLKKSEEADTYQRNGELLTAHMHQIKQGDTDAVVTDYYDPDQSQVSIKLNPNKTPSENAQSYFKQYNKLKKSRTMVEQELEKTNAEIEYLDQLVQQVEGAREQDVEEIREELREQGYLKAKTQQKKNKKPNLPTPETYTATDGTTILVGHNNKQNEYLTMKLAHKQDTWLHTKDIPGSHVVIRSSEPSEETLEEAAKLAAWFSKSRLSSSVPVDYTLIRHVKKPNGAKPGFVTYDQQKTLYVTPGESLVKKLAVK
ncbi:Rqc2 family fibronectin-binding protein [Terribacillus halophilus]|uniref:Rqc2 family fibronectin-binding protein n=1 Tax=Terribacillus halophilus TaxID=361279 RepID=UPI0009856641|nr:NFACT RNA binding domain-containing protein [Terribacillus halophilus]